MNALKYKTTEQQTSSDRDKSKLHIRKSGKELPDTKEVCTDNFHIARAWVQVPKLSYCNCER